MLFILRLVANSWFLLFTFPETRISVSSITPELSLLIGLWKKKKEKNKVPVSQSVGLSHAHVPLSILLLLLPLLLHLLLLLPLLLLLLTNSPTGYSLC